MILFTIAIPDHTPIAGMVLPVSHPPLWMTRISVLNLDDSENSKNLDGREKVLIISQVV